MNKGLYVQAFRVRCIYSLDLRSPYLFSYMSLTEAVSHDVIYGTEIEQIRCTMHFLLITSASIVDKLMHLQLL